MDLAVTTDSFSNEDHSWLASARGVDNMETIEVDLSLFTPATHFPNDYLPSGLVLAKVTATGKYGPYDQGSEADEVQTLTQGATGGTFGITFGGESSADDALDWDATAAEVEDALVALAGVNEGDLTVTGGPGGTAAWVVTATATGQFAEDPIPAIETIDTNLTGGTGTVAVVETTAGAGATVSNGLETARGHLGFSLDVGLVETGSFIGSLFTFGKVDESNLPSGHGLDDTAKAALPHVQYV